MEHALGSGDETAKKCSSAKHQARATPSRATVDDQVELMFSVPRVFFFIFSDLLCILDGFRAVVGPSEHHH